jgi:two-component system response regulator VanR
VRVLVAEDEMYLAEAIQTVLSREGMAVDVVHDGDDALERLAVNDYDALVLDRDLPGTHGDDVCRSVSTDGSGVAVLMLTASGQIAQRVEGLELGADDYLTKPFAFPELIARLRTLARRPREAQPPVLEVADVRLDPFRHEVYRAGHYVRMSRKEFAVLEVLMRAKGGAVSAERLLEKAWDENADPFSNSVRVTVSTLRKRLGEPGLIETLSGVGYRIADRSPSTAA